MVIGEWTEATSALARLTRSGHQLHLLPRQATPIALPCVPHLVLALVTTPSDIAQAQELGSRSAAPWVAICHDALLAERALRHGALIAHTAGSPDPSSLIEHAVVNVLSATADRAELSPGNVELRRHRSGEPVVASLGQGVEVRDGVVSLRGLHEDGQEVLLGLFGPGHLLVPSAELAGPRRVLAHTDTTIRVRPWRDLAADPASVERLQQRARLLELWLSAQGHPSVDRRLLAVLAILADEFGSPVDEGLLIDVRLTHADLASAISADRTTVTRALAQLVRRRRVILVGTGPSRRYCLPLT